MKYSLLKSRLKQGPYEWRSRIYELLLFPFNIYKVGLVGGRKLHGNIKTDPPYIKLMAEAI
jgi:hypothetical protein